MVMKEGMTFGQALVELKAGAKVKRVGWAYHLFVMEFEYGPRIMMAQDGKNKVSAQWGQKQRDMMAEDWLICNGERE
jgi:hypothetical protein